MRNSIMAKVFDASRGPSDLDILEIQTLANGVWMTHGSASRLGITRTLQAMKQMNPAVSYRAIDHHGALVDYLP